MRNGLQARSCKCKHKWKILFIGRIIFYSQFFLLGMVFIIKVLERCWFIYKIITKKS